MYKVWHSNFKQFIKDDFETIESAIDHAIKCGFRISVYEDATLVATWCPDDGKRLLKKVD